MFMGVKTGMNYQKLKGISSAEEEWNRYLYVITSSIVVVLILPIFRSIAFVNIRFINFNHFQ